MHHEVKIYIHMKGTSIQIASKKNQNNVHDQGLSTPLNNL